MSGCTRLPYNLLYGFKDYLIIDKLSNINDTLILEVLVSRCKPVTSGGSRGLFWLAFDLTFINYIASYKYTVVKVPSFHMYSDIDNTG